MDTPHCTSHLFYCILPLLSHPSIVGPLLITLSNSSRALRSHEAQSFFVALPLL